MVKDDYEVLKLEDFQGPFTWNKIFTALFCSVFKDFQGPGQMDTSFMEVWPPCIYGYSSFAVLSA